MLAASDISALRSRLAPHGYHVFLRPDRPTGWWVILRGAGTRFRQPLETRAATREEAITLAERFFVTHRMSELDGAIRAAGLIPPPWEQDSQVDRLTVLAEFARVHGIDV